MKIALTVSYDGSFFFGWQRQKDKLSGQQIVEDGIFSLTGERVKVTGSGRTDAGVHAEGQVCHFNTNSTIPPEKFFLALNIHLPSYLKAIESREVDDKFNARSSAKEKTYQYKIYLSPAEKPLKDRYSARVYGNLDIEKMKECANLLVGEHDFKAFSASGTTVKTTVRTIKNLTIEQKGEDITFTVTGTGFLYNMVRIIVGTLIKAGRGYLDKNDIEKMLNLKERTLGGDTMPAKGLTLLSVKY